MTNGAEPVLGSGGERNNDVTPFQEKSFYLLTGYALYDAARQSQLVHLRK